jgi:formate hydrogenlyase subunit 3/multisubunit Na+/H+ antiporter MnhD subunit
MPSYLVFIIILPLIGAVGTLILALVPRLRPYAHYIALGAIAPTTVLVLILRWMGPIVDVTSLWQPSLLFGLTPILQNSDEVQPLAFTLTLATCATILMTLTRESPPRPQVPAVLLVLLSASFTALWSANPLTMIVGWAIYDLVLAAGHIAADGWGRSAVRGLVFGGLSTLLLWGGTLLSVGEGGSSLWTLMTPSEAQLTLWVAAAVLRLWVYPFHLVAPDTLKSLRTLLSWVSVGVTGATLLAVTLAAGNAPAVISAGCAVWTLGMAVLFSAGGLQQEAPWWSIPALIGALTLLGVPLTLGFVSQATLLGGIANAGRLWWGAAFFFGNLFLVASLARWLLAPAASPLPTSYWQLAVYGVGLGIPALLPLAAGFYPALLVVGVPSLSSGALFSTPGLAGWSMWVISLAVGGVLAWQEENVRPRIALLLDAFHDLLRLDWLYDALVGALERGLSAIRAADEIVEGAGALLWSLLIFLLLLLIWSSQ